MNVTNVLVLTRGTLGNIDDFSKTFFLPVIVGTLMGLLTFVFELTIFNLVEMMSNFCKRGGHLQIVCWWHNAIGFSEGQHFTANVWAKIAMNEMRLPYKCFPFQLTRDNYNISSSFNVYN